MRFTRTTLVSIAALCLVPSLSIARQHNNAPIVLVDGAIHPEKIPEAVAFRMFFRTLAQPANPTPEQVDRQRSMVAPANLSESDLRGLAQVMSDYHFALESLRHEFRAAKASLGGIDEYTSQKLTAERDAIVDDAKTQLTANLSAEGMARLRNLILSERKNMAIYTSAEGAAK